jgi:hypothetical protein
MPTYEPMRCCVCGKTIRPDTTIAAKAPSSIADCMYRCVCGVAYSNARDPSERTLIWPTPEQNVPDEVAFGPGEALDRAVNVRNRKMKRWKFAFETSEDAVTWTIVRGLAAIGRLGAVSGGDDPEVVLLWGAPVVGGTVASDIAEELATVCEELGERPNAYSEPDVVLVWPDRIVVLEAKYRSPNDVNPGHKGFPLYLDVPDLFAVDPTAVTAAGFYELTRNWRIGADLAKRLSREFTLLNIGRKEAAGSAAQFSALLAQTPGRRFGFLTWAELLDRAAQVAPLPAWLDDYAGERGLRA